MKSLLRIIKEEYETFRINNLEITYKCEYEGNSEISFRVPSTYSEDDFQIYLQDLYFDKLPGEDKRAEKFFGKNADNIYDILFEYEKYEKSDEEPDTYIDWDDPEGKHDENAEYSYITVSDLVYIIKFEEFDFNDKNSSDIDNLLVTIFKTTESSTTNDYPITLTFDDKNIKYEEE